MDIYTVTCLASVDGMVTRNSVVGSYISRGDAIDACVGKISEMIGFDVQFLLDFSHDENHEEVREMLNEGKDVLNAGEDGLNEDLVKYIRDEIGGNGCYYVSCMNNMYHFDVEESNLKGQLFNLVMWRDMSREIGCGPRPELYLTKEAAVKGFIEYAVWTFKYSGVDIPVDLRETVSADIDRNWGCSVYVNDDVTVNCALYLHQNVDPE